MIKKVTGNHTILEIDTELPIKSYNGKLVDVNEIADHYYFNEGYIFSDDLIKQFKNELFTKNQHLAYIFLEGLLFEGYVRNKIKNKAEIDRSPKEQELYEQMLKEPTFAKVLFHQMPGKEYIVKNKTDLPDLEFKTTTTLEKAISSIKGEIPSFNSHGASQFIFYIEKEQAVYYFNSSLIMGPYKTPDFAEMLKELKAKL